MAVQETDQGGVRRPGLGLEVTEERPDRDLDQHGGDEQGAERPLRSGRWGPHRGLDAPPARGDRRGDHDEGREDHVRHDPVDDPQGHALLGHARPAKDTLEHDDQYDADGAGPHPSPRLGPPQVHRQHDRREPHEQAPETVGVLHEGPHVTLHEIQRKERQEVTLGIEPSLHSESGLEPGDEPPGDQHRQDRHARHHAEARRPVRGGRRRRVAERRAPRTEHAGERDEPADPRKPSRDILGRRAAQQAREDEQGDETDAQPGAQASTPRAPRRSAQDEARSEQADHHEPGRDPRRDEAGGERRQVEQRPDDQRRAEDDGEEVGAFVGIGWHERGETILLQCGPPCGGDGR
jgi:hypothetical protein